MSAEEMLAVVGRLRARTPGHRPPVGAVVERDAREPALARTSYGTHGTVHHPPGHPVTAAAVARQRDAFAARGEPAEWPVFAHDAEPLPGLLRAAGFTPGRERAVLAAEVDGVTTGGTAAAVGQVRAAWGRRELSRVAELAGGAFAEFLADGRALCGEAEVLALEEGGRIRAASWITSVREADAAVIGGTTAAHPAFVPAWARWARGRRAGGAVRYLVAEAGTEADGAAELAVPERPGFRAVTTVTTYRWEPPGGPAETTRPVRLLFDDPEHDRMWDAWCERFAFRPSMHRAPGIDEPPASVTWHLGEADPGALQVVAERGLRAVVRPGEPLYWLDWHHAGYRFDPPRVGVPGQPAWPGAAWPDHEYFLYVSADLRLGTFGHPWERSLCVFGAELLAEVETELTALLGPVLRRGGQNAVNR